MNHIGIIFTRPIFSCAPPVGYADYTMLHHTTRSRLNAGGLTSLLWVGLFLCNPPFLRANVPCTVGPQEIGGVVFHDPDFDGLCGPYERSRIAGVTVRLTDAAGNIQTATTDAAGQFSFTGLTAADTYRIVFSTLPDWAQPTLRNTANGTLVQFLLPGNCANLGVANPLDYSQEEPQYVAGCFVGDDPFNGANTTEPALARSPYLNNGNKTNLDFKPPVSELGSIFGLAWQPESESIFAASYLKSVTGFGPDVNGNATTGGIYRIIEDAGGNPVVTLFADLQSLGTGADPHPQPTDQCQSALFNPAPDPPSNAACWIHDPGAFGLQGKMSLGDLELAPDGQHLFTVNLFERTLIKLPIGTDPTAPVAGTPQEFPLAGLFGDCAATGDWRPFALARHKGKMYLGAVCSAQSTQLRTDMEALVYEFDPDDPTSFTQIFQFGLDYERNGPIRNCGGTSCIAEWQPWTDNLADITFYTRGSQPSKDATRPMPMLTDIEFFGDDLILAFRDRTADMFGDNSGNPTDFNDAAQYSAVSAGDILRAARQSDGSYQLESNGQTGPYTTSATYPGFNSTPDGKLNSGPGGGEFYSEGFATHAELPVGGLSIRRGSNEVVITSMNPHTSTVSSGGVATYRNSDGQHQRGVAFFDGATDFDFGKGNGMGDAILLTAPAPLEIGNYVWHDLDGDGLQDADEPGIENVNVSLYDASGTLLATVMTNASGEYYFNDQTPGLTGGLAPRTDYIVVVGSGGQFDTGTHGLSANGTDYRLTSAEAGGDDQVDSDGTLAAGVHANVDGFPHRALTTGDAGAVDHSHDFGFVSCQLTVSFAPPDCDNNGSRANTADDFFTVDVTATNGLPAAGTLFQVVLGAAPDGTGGTILATGSYGQTLTVGQNQEFAANGTATYALTVREVDGFGCFETQTVGPVATCSSCPPQTCGTVSINGNGR